MQNMKRFYTTYLFFLFFICIGNVELFAQTSSNENSRTKFTISKVRVFLDEEELLPEKSVSSTKKSTADSTSNSSEVSTLDSTSDSSENPAAIKLSTILSFTKLKAGKEYTETKLQKEMAQTELRLLNSGFFYNATVEKIESRKNPGTYIIYINVTTGFLKRFGGGGIYAVFGDTGLHGNREQLLWFAGWNKNGASYLYENAFETPLIFGADLFTNVPAGFTNDEGVNLNGKITFGSFITPDLRFCVDVDATYNFKQIAFTNDLAISPYLSITKFFSEKLFSTTEVRFFYYPLNDWEQMFDTAYTINYSPVKNFTFAGLAAGGYCTNNVTKGLSLNRDNTKLSENLGLSNRGIRSGYSDDDLAVRGYLMGTLEIRWNAFNFTIPPCFPCGVVPYIYADVAAVEKLSDAKGKVSIMDAYGFGIQLNFECPVFAYFNFSYGFNHQGKGKFCFAAVQSF